MTWKAVWLTVSSYGPISIFLAGTQNSISPLLSLLTSGKVCSHYLSEYSKCTFSLLHFLPVGWVFHWWKIGLSLINHISHTSIWRCTVWSSPTQKARGIQNWDYSCGNDTCANVYRQLNFLHAGEQSTILLQLCMMHLCTMMFFFNLKMDDLSC